MQSLQANLETFALCSCLLLNLLLAEGIQCCRDRTRSGITHHWAEMARSFSGCAGSSIPLGCLAWRCSWCVSVPPMALPRWCRTSREPCTHALPHLSAIHHHLHSKELTPALTSLLYLAGHHSPPGNARHISQLSKLEPFTQGKGKEAAPTGLGVNSWQRLYFSLPMQPQLMFPLVSYLYSQEVGLSIWTVSVSWLILPKC